MRACAYRAEEADLQNYSMAAATQRSIGDSALFTVEERLETFKESGWPFSSGSCTPLKVRLKSWRERSAVCYVLATFS